MAAAAPAAAAPSSSKWDSDQDKQFEKALASWDDEECSRWEDLAALLPGKSAAEVKKHFDLLVQDVKSIEAGLIPLPAYTPRDALVKEHQQQQQSMATPPLETKKSGLPSSSSSMFHHHHHHHHHTNGSQSQNPSSSAAAAAANASNNNAGSSSKGKAQDQERRKGIPWTEDEHRLFLLGLEKFGKGDWRSISRNFVVSRTPTQVASHAQKYFIRLNSIHKDKRRTSIHDITSVNGDGRQQPQAPITGQGGAGVSPGAGAPPAGAPGSSGAAVGQPAPPYSQPAVGTPVNVHHAGFAGRSHVSGRPVPGTPLMAYPMPQPAMHH